MLCCQAARGGAAVFSAGTTTFHGKADFLGNGQYDADADGYEPSNEDGGALSNTGTMTVRVPSFLLSLAAFIHAGRYGRVLLYFMALSRAGNR